MKLFDIISEDEELDEGFKSDEQWLDELKRKFPDWDYSNAVIYSDGRRKKIKNVFCTIHDHSFPEEGRSEGIDIDKHKNGTGCYDCGKEVWKEKFKEKRTYGKEDWLEKLNGVKHFKNKYDFSKSKFLFVEPLKNGPLVTHTYCKIHKKYFNGGKDDQGIRASHYPVWNYPCPLCRKESQFEKNAISYEDWIDRFKSNERNKKYDYSKSEIYYEEGDNKAKVYNIKCNVKGLNGKKHGVFGQEGLRALNHANGNAQCPKCGCEDKQKEFIQQSNEIHGNKYVYDKVDFCDKDSVIKKENGNYTSYIRKVLIGCKKPNHGYFFQNTSIHKTGAGCPICRESKGENYIDSLLKSKFGGKYTILRENDATFKTLMGKKGLLPYDFYIPELKVLIEYDGEQHFYPVFGSSDYTRNLTYNTTFTNDNLKNNFIKTNTEGIRLIRVPYTMEFNEIDGPLLQAIKIKNTPPNTITYLGDYPRRHNRKEVQSQFKLNESKLSLMSILGS